MDVENEQKTRTITGAGSTPNANALSMGLSSTDSAQAVPEKLGRYQIQEPLGAGGMASVYAAYDPKMDRKVAIKILNQASRFDQEARAGSASDHPNIVGVYDVGEEAGFSYIVMQLIDAADLEALFVQKDLFSTEEVIGIGIQVAHALAHSHAHNVIHRDIKPSNILYNVNSKKAWITDFGIARVPSFEKTQCGVFLGTPYYMSPEQIEERGVDGRSDVFSLGVVLYELMSGKRAFPGENPVTIAKRVCGDSPADWRQVKRAWHTPLVKVIEKCLHKNPDQRYESAEALADALIHVQKALGKPSLGTVLKTYLPQRLGARWMSGVMFLMLPLLFLFNLLLSSAWEGQQVEQSLTGFQKATRAFELGATIENAIKVEVAVPPHAGLDNTLNEFAAHLAGYSVTVVNAEGSVIGGLGGRPKGSNIGSLSETFSGLEAVTSEAMQQLSAQRLRSNMTYRYLGEANDSHYLIQWPITYYGKNIGYLYIDFPQQLVGTSKLGSVLAVNQLPIWVKGFLAIFLALPLVLVWRWGSELKHWTQKYQAALQHIGEGEAFKSMSQSGEAEDAIFIEHSKALELATLEQECNHLVWNLYRQLGPNADQTIAESPMVNSALSQAMGQSRGQAMGQSRGQSITGGANPATEQAAQSQNNHLSQGSSGGEQVSVNYDESVDEDATRVIMGGVPFQSAGQTDLTDTDATRVLTPNRNSETGTMIIDSFELMKNKERVKGQSAFQVDKKNLERHETK